MEEKEFKDFVKNIVKLSNDYAGHKDGCSKLKTMQMFKEIEKTAKDCGNQNIQLGSNVKCSCGFSKLIKDIQKVLGDYQ